MKESQSQLYLTPSNRSTPKIYSHQFGGKENEDGDMTKVSKGKSHRTIRQALLK